MYEILRAKTDKIEIKNSLHQILKEITGKVPTEKQRVLVGECIESWGCWYWRDDTSYIIIRKRS